MRIQSARGRLDAAAFARPGRKEMTRIAAYVAVTMWAVALLMWVAQKL